MKRITRNIDPREARDLLERAPRAGLTFVDARGPEAEPVAVFFKNERHLVGVPSDRPRPADGEEVVLLIDEGFQFFDLRAI